MSDKKKRELTNTVISNDDYFFRDSEMQRVDLNDPQHQTDPTFDKERNKKNRHGN